ncbi:MAG: acylneuraminate cytidylyltransferase family protein [Actinobacteria bacterium]|nr:MAG: acylneuraminate cytidylyltransferase family protein [Actinomycetota bacterium]
MPSAPVIALVPARSGSKGLPHKNLADLGGFPLLAYSVLAGLLAEAIDRVLVTSDAPELAEVGIRFGAEAPFLRPAALANDDSPDLGYVRHALDWLAEAEGTTPELVVQLRPTTPLRDPQLVDRAVAALRARPEATGLRSVHQLPEPPQKMFGIKDGWLTGLFPQDERPEYYNLPRQAFPPAYHPNGYVDVVRPDIVRAQNGLYGSRVLACITPSAIEIDGAEELDYARYLAERDGHPLLERLRSGQRGG